MKFVYNWLKEFTPIAATPEELRSRLSMAGIAVDAIDESPAGPVVDAEITNNRPDLLGHIGLAREISAVWQLQLKLPHPHLKESADALASAAQVAIECPDLCARYTARVIRDVKVQPSPDWLRQRIEALGHSSISNIVDATNYVMFETGQPLHAFDFDRLAGHRIVVRRARPGETMRTLDGVERKLGRDMCLICDAQSPVAIGGIMGGAESEISFSTKNILIESAWFDPIAVRRASKALGLRTEASLRFERGADIEQAELASRRATELIAQLAGGEILANIVDVFPHRPEPREIEFSRKELLRVMGADVPDRLIDGIFATLGLAPRRTDVHAGSVDSLVAEWKCTAPSWRGDLKDEIDLIEEVARIYGYDKFPPRLPASKLPAQDLPLAREKELLRERLVALGYEEIVSIPLVDPERDAIFRTEQVTAAEIGNPLSEDASILRTSGLVSMAGTLEWNINHGQKNLRLFEFGKMYEVRAGKPVETPVLTVGATGFAQEQSVHGAARPFSFADLKGALDQLLVLAGGAAWTSAALKWLEPDLGAEIRFASNGNENGKSIGFAGELSRAVTQKIKLRQIAFLAELRLDELAGAVGQHRAALRYEPLPCFPAVERDFSLVLDEKITFADVAAAIENLRIPELRDVRAVDSFRGGQIPPGKYSLLVRVTLQSADATFTEAQLTDISNRIIGVLEEKLGSSLRAR